MGLSAFFNASIKMSIAVVYMVRLAAFIAAGGICLTTSATVAPNLEASSSSRFRRSSLSLSTRVLILLSSCWIWSSNLLRLPLRDREDGSTEAGGLDIEIGGRRDWALWVWVDGTGEASGVEGDGTGQASGAEVDGTGQASGAEVDGTGQASSVKITSGDVEGEEDVEEEEEVEEEASADEMEGCS